MSISIGCLARRLLVLVRRFVTSRKLGVSFYGTGRFVCPNQIQANGVLVDLQVPIQN